MSGSRLDWDKFRPALQGRRRGLRRFCGHIVLLIFGDKRASLGSYSGEGRVTSNERGEKEQESEAKGGSEEQKGKFQTQEMAERS